MVRTQIQLTEEQARRLRLAATQRGVSLAELIRQGVELVLIREPAAGRDEAYERAARASGGVRSGATDTSVRHDDGLAEAYAK